MVECLSLRLPASDSAFISFFLDKKGRKNQGLSEVRPPEFPGGSSCISLRAVPLCFGYASTQRRASVHPEYHAVESSFII